MYYFKANKVPLAPKRRPRRERPASSAITAIPISIPCDGPRWAERIIASATRTPWTIATRHRYLIPCTITAVIYWALVRPTTTSPSGRGRITRTSDSRISASKVPWRPRRNCKFHDPGDDVRTFVIFKDCHRIIRIRERERLRCNPIMTTYTYSIP